MKAVMVSKMVDNLGSTMCGKKFRICQKPPRKPRGGLASLVGHWGDDVDSAMDDTRLSK